MAEKTTYFEALLLATGWAGKVGRRSDQLDRPRVRSSRRNIPACEVLPAIRLPDVGGVRGPDGWTGHPMQIGSPHAH